MTISPQPSQRSLHGLALFAGVMTTVALAVAVGSNILFKRSLAIEPHTSENSGAVNSPPKLQVNETAKEGVVASAGAVAQAGYTVPKASAAPLVDNFAPPSESSMPDGEFGKMVRLGEQVFVNTRRFAPMYVGNSLNCASCHLDAGRKANAAPMWASFIQYPAFRSKTGRVDTLAQRIQECFEYSMNGKAPPVDGEIVTALQTYAFWLARGAPVGTALPGSGFPELNKPTMPADYGRGEAVYLKSCALCHGTDGQGQRSGDQQVFPPLWGPESFNWAAGMHQLSIASGFIRANMPLSKDGSLSEQEAWDVALYMNSHERPQDPRFAGSVEATRKKFHDSEESMYGRIANGRVLGGQ